MRVPPLIGVGGGGSNIARGCVVTSCPLQVPPDGTKQRLALKQLLFQSLQLFTNMACDTFQCSQVPVAAGMVPGGSPGAFPQSLTASVSPAGGRVVGAGAADIGLPGHCGTDAGGAGGAP